MQRVTARPTSRPTSRPTDRATGPATAGRPVGTAGGAVARRAGARLPLVVVAGGLASLLFSANLASPLYAVYGQRLGFSSAVLALIFAVYALVLIPSLLAFGQVSDRFGRRRVIAAGLGVGIAGLVLFAAAGGVGWLFAARAVQGLSVGMISGAATAALVEFEPRNDPRRAALLATLANTGGSAAGPVVAGVLAQGAAAPTALPFAAGIGLCVVAAALARVPEPIEPGTGRWRPQLPRVPREIRADFLRVGLTAAAVWSVAGLFLSVVPSFVRAMDASGNLALVGATTSVMLAASCAAQLAAHRGAPPVAARAGGLGLLALGLLALVLAAPLRSGALVVAGAALAGVGHGVAFLAAQHDLTRIAPADRRAAVTSAFYTCIYLGVALPVIGAGVIASAVSLAAGIAVFATVTGAASLALAGWHLRRGRERRGAPGPDDRPEEWP